MAFGRLKYNDSLLDGYCPSMFSNGPKHEKQKEFLMKICKVAQSSKVLPVAIKVVTEYLRKWEHAGTTLPLGFYCISLLRLQPLMTPPFQ